jgi:hypothetical protein
LGFELDTMPRISVELAALFLVGNTAFCQNVQQRTSPASDWGVEFYAQGGVVVEGIAYFTSDDGDYVKTGLRSPSFPGVVAFDVRTLRKVRTYPISQTYDSSPFLFQKKDGTWLVIAHEYKKKRTVACRRDTGRIEWISEANQPGAYFFGYCCFRRSDETRLIFMACQNGLHAMSGETGKDVWWVKQGSTGGITPCVDQKQGCSTAPCFDDTHFVPLIEWRRVRGKCAPSTVPTTGIRYETNDSCFGHGAVHGPRPSLLGAGCGPVCRSRRRGQHHLLKGGRHRTQTRPGSATGRRAVPGNRLHPRRRLVQG